VSEATIGIADLRGDPTKVAASIERCMALTAICVAHDGRDLVVLEAIFAPTLELEANDFPIERARIAQLSDTRHPLPYVLPVGPSRAWHHRYPFEPAAGAFGQLCMWYPADPPYLTWTWTKGLVDLVEIARRHLWFEEHFRRTGTWPVEDAPHGQRTDGSPHPIRTTPTLPFGHG
jgi:hypothetical protein